MGASGRTVVGAVAGVVAAVAAVVFGVLPFLRRRREGEVRSQMSDPPDGPSAETSDYIDRTRERPSPASDPAIEQAQRPTRPWKRIISSNTRSFLFFVAAVIFLAIAYPFYTSATGAPELDYRGFVLAFTDDPTISLDVQLYYTGFQTYSRGKPSSSYLEEYETPSVGNDKIIGLVVDVIQTTNGTSASPAPHHFLIVLGGAAQLKDVRVNNDITWSTFQQAQIEFSDVSATSGIEMFEGELPGANYGTQFSGTLIAPVTDSAAGRTFVKVPSLGSAEESDYYSAGIPNKDVASNQVLIDGKYWFEPKSVNYRALVGVLPIEESIDESRPALNTTNPDLLEWTGSQILFPEVELSNGPAEQDSQKAIFLAGVLAGISGGLLVEAVSAVRRARPTTPGTTGQISNAT
jgi:hypothetical protein